MPLKREKDPEKRAKDLAWATAIKKRDGKCVWCGSTSKLAADHVFSRKTLATRWDEHNGVALCCGCHMFRKKYEPMLWALSVIDKFGMETLLKVKEAHERKEG